VTRTTTRPLASRLALAAAVGLSATLALGGCSESVDEASADYCTSVDNLDAELASLASLVSGDATLDEIQAQRDAVSGAYDETTAAAGDLEESVSSAAESAYGDFQDAVDAIPGDATLTEAAGQYADAARQYAASLATVAADAGCETPE
jgi:hypothetical protein